MPPEPVMIDLIRRLERLERQVERLATREYAGVGGVHATAYDAIFDGTKALTAGNSDTSGDFRGSNGVPSNAKGIVAGVSATSSAAGGLRVDSADDTPDGYSSIVRFPAAGTYAGIVWIRLGTGANAGKIKILANTADFSAIYLWPVGWWR